MHQRRLQEPETPIPQGQQGVSAFLQFEAQNHFTHGFRHIPATLTGLPSVTDKLGLPYNHKLAILRGASKPHFYCLKAEVLVPNDLLLLPSHPCPHSVPVLPASLHP